jgi:hypothetical protein
MMKIKCCNWDGKFKPLSIYQHFDIIPPGILNCSSYSQSDNNDGSSSRHE